MYSLPRSPACSSKPRHPSSPFSKHQSSAQPASSLPLQQFSMDNPRQQTKRRRVVTACAECHRRKQKCDRKTPCNVCLAREVPEKCSYGGPTTDASEPIPKSTGHSDRQGYSALDGATAFGDLKKLLEGDNFFRAATSNNNKTQYVSEAEAKYVAFVKKLPARPMLQELIDLYFIESNWSYPIAERPFFNELFEKWSALDPANTRYTGPQGLPRELQYFPAVLFQMCAIALQLIPPTAKCIKELGLANATACDRLSQKLSDISMEIMNILGRHDPALSAVQTDFLRAVWLKSASRGTESWHALVDSIRQAQELGLHRQADIQQSASLEETLRQLWYDEHKRRIWILLFTWNSFMAFVLGRPRHINLSDCDIRTPIDCNMPDNPSKKVPLATPAVGDDEAPSLFSSMLVQYELAKKVHEIRETFADRPYTKDYNLVWNFHRQILDIMHNAPPLIRPENPDTSFDAKYPVLPKKREQILTVANNLLMVLHRPHMANHVESRKAAVQAALTTLDSQERLFKTSQPYHYKLFALTFYTIDASIFITAIILMYPPRDEEVKKRINDAVVKGMKRLDLMAKSNPTASSGSLVVHACYEKVKDILKPQGPESTGTMASVESAWSGATLAEPGPSGLVGHAQYSTMPDFSTELDNGLALPEEDMTSLAFYDNPNTFDSNYWLDAMNQIPDLAPEDDPNNQSTWSNLLL